MRVLRYKRLLRQHEITRYEFIVIELDLAITFLEIALSAKDENKSQRNEEHANVALSAARRFLSEASLSEQTRTEIEWRLSRVSSLQHEVEETRAHD